MFYDGKIWAAQNDKPICMLLPMANRHGLISGATGTGKTISLKVLSEAFSDAGVPVFFADVKGDLSGMCLPGTATATVEKRVLRFGLLDKGYSFRAYPIRYWDVYGEKGTPVRATVSEMGPLLISRILGLNEIQEGVMDIIFHVADDEKLLLLDLKDLRTMVQYVGDNAESFRMQYGNVAPTSIGAIQRALLRLEDQGGAFFFGEPALEIEDWMSCDEDGRGYINNLNCEKLFLNPVLYSTFLLWMLSELYETLPEVGDLDKPKMVFFFDEAHLLFNNISRELQAKIEQVVRLIRSKGVGIFFVTQSPTDIPDSVLGQLGNRIEHAMRAYSLNDQKAVRAAAATFRQNPLFDTEQVLTQLETGEALVQFLDEKGAPNVVERAYILPPQSMMGVIDDDLRARMVAASGMDVKYREMVDRVSAYEMMHRTAQAVQQNMMMSGSIPTSQSAAYTYAQQVQSGTYAQPQAPQTYMYAQQSAPDPQAPQTYMYAHPSAADAQAYNFAQQTAAAQPQVTAPMGDAVITGQVPQQVQMPAQAAQQMTRNTAYQLAYEQAYSAAKNAYAAGAVQGLAKQYALSAATQIADQYARQVEMNQAAYKAQVEAAKAAHMDTSLIPSPPSSEKPFTTAEISRIAGDAEKQATGEVKAAARAEAEEKKAAEKKKKEKADLFGKAASSGVRSFSSYLGRALGRGLLGSWKKK